MQMFRSLAHRFVLAIVLAITVLSAPAFAQAQPAPQPAPSTLGSIGDVISGVFMDGLENTDYNAKKEEIYKTLSARDCVSCMLFDSFASATFSGLDTANSSGRDLIPVLTSIASIFALFYLGSAFVSGDASDLLGRWQVFWRLLLTVAFASVILLSPVTYVWNYVYGPLFSIGDGVVQLVGAKGGAQNCGANLSIQAGVPSGARSALESMSSTICGAYNLSLKGLSTGIALAFNGGGFVKAIMFFATGFVVTVMYTFLAFTFPLRFIDVVIKLAIVSLITPLLVVAAAFKPSRGYATIGISNVLNATAQFAILSIVFFLGNKVFQNMEAEGFLTVNTDGDITSTAITCLMYVGIAMVFNALVGAVPSIAAEFSRHSGSGGGEAGASATKVMMAPVVAAGRTAGFAVAAPVALGAGKMASRKVAGDIAAAVGSGAGRLGKGSAP